MAVNCSAVPSATVGLAGAILIEVNTGVVTTVTVKLLELLMFPEAAVMVAVPTPAAVANPLGFTVATDVFEEPQFTDAVKSWVLPSVKVPVAVNCCVLP